jgi:uncharacterized protein
VGTKNLIETLIAMQLYKTQRTWLAANLALAGLLLTGSAVSAQALSQQQAQAQPTVITQSRARPVQPVPFFNSHVTDQTSTLSAPEIQELESKLAQAQINKNVQVVVLIVETTEPENIEEYSLRVANTADIGGSVRGRGLLLVVAKNDHWVRIGVANPLGESVSNQAAGNIIDNTLNPSFRKGDFAGGINAGVDQLLELISPLPGTRAPL